MDTPSTETVLTSGDQANTAAAGGNDAPGNQADKPNDNANPQGAATTEGSEGNPSAGDKPAADPAKDGKPEGEKPAGAPEQYADFKVPEGYEVDPQLLSDFTPLMKDLDLSQEKAQKVVDFVPKLVDSVQTKTVAAVLDHMGLTDFPTWGPSLKTDKEFGGEKLDENLSVAKKALTTFGTPELSAVLAKTGLGNHPEIIRAFWKVGQQIKEDGFVSGAKTSAASTATSLYDKSNMNP